MTMSDEQVAAMAAALKKQRLPDNQVCALHQAIDGVYNDIRAFCEMCVSSDVPEPVWRPLIETAKDIGGLRDAFLDVRLALAATRDGRGEPQQDPLAPERAGEQVIPPHGAGGIQ